MQPKVKILFVDDEVRIVRLLNMMFRATCDVLCATSGLEALDLLRTHDVDILCTDQRMPGMLGIELLARAREVSPRTLRLLLTGYTDVVAMISAINEGDVYRFLNKPWNHEELKLVIEECAALSRAGGDTPWRPVPGDPDGSMRAPLASAVKLLALDGVASDRHEVMEMFTPDCEVIGAQHIDEAREAFGQHDIGVLVTDTRVGGEETLALLRDLKRSHPALTTVMLSRTADSETVVRLINQAHVYRYAMKPIQPNVFRLAVAAAMREHQRLRDTLPTARAPGEMSDRIVGSLSRFTKMW